MDTRNRDKFAKPRGWALKWVLTQEMAPSTAELTQEMAPSTAEQGVEKGDETWEKFAEPRGWALKWDGFALPDADVEESQDAPAPSPAVTSC